MKALAALAVVLVVIAVVAAVGAATVGVEERCVVEPSSSLPLGPDQFFSLEKACKWGVGRR